MGVVLDQVGEGEHDGVRRLAYAALGDGLCQLHVAAVLAAGRPPVEGDAVAVAGLLYPVRLGERRAESLLRVDALDAVLSSKDYWLRARKRWCGHADDVGLLHLDHLPVVEVGVVEVPAVTEGLHPLGAAVRHSDHLGLLDGRVGGEVGVGFRVPVRVRLLVLHQPGHSSGPDDRHFVFRHAHLPTVFRGRLYQQARTRRNGPAMREWNGGVCLGTVIRACHGLGSRSPSAGISAFCYLACLESSSRSALRRGRAAGTRVKSGCGPSILGRPSAQPGSCLPL